MLELDVGRGGHLGAQEAEPEQNKGEITFELLVLGVKKPTNLQRFCILLHKNTNH